jgi:chromate transport protein ChrA
MKFREKLARFMYGRNGADHLGMALLWVYLALAIAAVFFKPLYILALLLVGWMLFRIFSKNLYKRQAENQKYLRLVGKVKGWVTLQKNKVRDRKTHRYRTCPHCRATLRLPNKKGRHTVCCPKCRKDFEVKI